MAKYRVLPLLLLICSSVVAYCLYAFAPWHIDIQDFLVRPILQYTLPAALIGLLLLVYPPQSWGMQTILGLVLLPTLFVLLMQCNWPAPGLPTSWEDSYQVLFLVGLLIQLWCWLAWVFLLLAMFVQYRARRAT